VRVTETRVIPGVGIECKFELVNPEDWPKLKKAMGLE
jgi:hypothetical protein